MNNHSVLLLFVCVGVCMCVHLCMQIYSPVLICKWRSMSSVFLSLSLFWSQHLSVSLELAVWGSLACLGSAFLLPPVLEMKHMLLDLASTWALGIQTLSPMLSQQSIYPQSRLPSPVFTTYDVIRESPGMGTLFFGDLEELHKLSNFNPSMTDQSRYMQGVYNRQKPNCAQNRLHLK